MPKRCGHCKQEKEGSEFCKDSSQKDGLAKTCKQCRHEICQKYVENNPEKRIASSRLYQNLHRDKVRESSRRWKETHVEQRRAGKRRYQSKRVRVEKDNGGSYTNEEWESLCAILDFRCWCCWEAKPLTPDHIIPLCDGGDSNISNIQPLCHRCNTLKGTKHTNYRMETVMA